MGFSLIKPGVLFAGLFVCGWPPGQFTTGTNPHSPRTQKKKPSSPRLLPSPSPSLLSVHSSLPLLAHTPGGPPGISAIKCKEGNNSITKGGLHTQGRRHLLPVGDWGRDFADWRGTQVDGVGPVEAWWKNYLPLTRGCSSCQISFARAPGHWGCDPDTGHNIFFLKKLTSAVSYKQVEPHFQHVSVKVSRKTQIYISCVMMNNWATIGC